MHPELYGVADDVAQIAEAGDERTDVVLGEPAGRPVMVPAGVAGEHGSALGLDLAGPLGDGFGVVERPVRAVDVIVIDVLAQDQPRVPLAGDQFPVQALAPGAGYPSPRDRVRPGRPDRIPMIRTLTAVNTASNAAVNLVSRSRIKNLKLSARP
jgi:hypothetical protein